MSIRRGTLSVSRSMVLNSWLHGKITRKASLQSWCLFSALGQLKGNHERWYILLVVLKNLPSLLNWEWQICNSKNHLLKYWYKKMKMKVCWTATIQAWTLEKEMATHPFSHFPGNIPWTEEPGRLQSMVAQSWTWLSD